MKMNSFRWLYIHIVLMTLAICGAAKLPASPVTTTTAFGISLTEGTLTVKDSGGNVLSTVNDLYFDGTIPQDLAQLMINGQPSFSQPPLGLPAFVQNNLGSFTTISDFDFLNGTGSNPELLTVGGNLKTSGVIFGSPSLILFSTPGDSTTDDSFPSVTTDLLSAAPGGAILDSRILTLDSENVYDIRGTNSDNTHIIEGDIVMAFFSENIVETMPAQNVPEASQTFSLLALAMAALLGLTKWKEVKQRAIPAYIRIIERALRNQ